MKITGFIPSLTGGGAERVMCELASHLVNKGYTVELLTLENISKYYPLDPRVSRKTLTPGYRFKFGPFRKINKMVNLYKYIKTSNSDAYVVFVFGGVWAISLLRKIIHVPIIISSRNTFNDPSEEKHFIYMSKTADGVVFQTEEVKKYITERVPSIFNSAIIPNAANFKYDASLEKIHQSKKNIIMGCGRLAEQKNFSLLIKSFSLIANDYPDWVLKIYGTGPLQNELVSLVQRLGLEDRVEFPGFVDNLYDIMLESGMFVLSSDYEGIPNVLLEAMSAGMPCIATDCSGGGARLLIHNEENGLLVPVKNEDKLAVAMKKIIEDKNFAKKISKQALNVCSEFSPEKIYSRWENFIIDTVERYRHKY